MGPAPDLAIRPCARERNGSGAEHGRIDHHQQNGGPEKAAGETADVERHLRGIGKSEAMRTGGVAREHHAARHGHRDARAQERVEPRPLQVREAQPFICDTALLEKELPGRDGGPDDGDHQENQVRREPAGGAVG